MDKEFAAWWPTLGQTIGKVAAWEAWKAGRESMQKECANVCDAEAQSYEDNGPDIVLSKRDINCMVTALKICKGEIEALPI